METKYSWAVEEIYGSLTEWEKDFEKVSQALDFSEFKGKLGNVDGFLACMKKS